MGDINHSNQYLSKPTNDVEQKWLEVKIQEKKSRISRAKQDIEDLKKGKIIQLEADIMMFEKDIKDLESKLEKISKVHTIDVENNDQGGK